MNPLQFRNWNELLLESGEYSIFHTANWARTLHEAYGFKPRYFAELAGGKLTALVPVMEVKSILTGCRGVSLPFSDFCEPILPQGVVQEALTESIVSHGQSAGWKFLELRGDRGPADDTPGYRQYYTHTLNLAVGGARLYGGLRDSTRRNIGKASRAGVSVRKGTSREYLEVFYRLHCVTRKYHGVPPQPYRFFEKLHEHLISKDMGTVFLADHNGGCIAGALFLHCGNKVLYKFGASARKCQHLRANNLIMWEAIRSFSSDGFEHFSFGRTEPDNNGLRQFKNGWGGDEQLLRYYRYDIRRQQYVPDSTSGADHFSALFAKMPLPLLKTMGKYLYRHMG